MTLQSENALSELLLDLTVSASVTLFIVVFFFFYFRTLAHVYSS